MNVIRILLLSDTHGDLAVINALVEKSQAAVVIHAGDFGFYDEESHLRLTDREIRLRIVHAPLPDDRKRDLLALPAEEQRRYVGEHLPLSQLPEFLRGRRALDVPVYAVWGNHEDIEVVKKFCSGEYAVPNLFVLHDRASYQLGRVRVFGLGGNVLPGRKLFQTPIAGGGGRLWSTLEQFGQLVEHVAERAADDEYRILVSHVSSGKEPLVTLLGVHTGADLIVSGHMGAPHTMVWNEFAIREPDQTAELLAETVAALRRELEGQDSKTQSRCAPHVERLADWQRESVSIGRGQTAPPWYQNMLHVNLPDAERGYAVLVVSDSDVGIETCSGRMADG